MYYNTEKADEVLWVIQLSILLTEIGNTNMSTIFILNQKVYKI